MSTREQLSFGPLVRRDMRFSGSPAGILVEALDYHTHPVHLTREELWELGVVIPRKEPQGLQPSSALVWRTAGSRWEPRGTLPDGPFLGEYVVARVDGGLDVFLVSYTGGRQQVGLGTLEGLGLRMRKTPLRRNRRRRLRIESSSRAGGAAATADGRSL